MDDFSTLKFFLTAFTTLLVVVDPLGVLPMFVSLMPDSTRIERAPVVRRAMGIALVICLFFLIAGHGALSYLGVTVHAFAISGGVLLFATALPMLFGQRPALQSSAPHESGPQDIAIFPLAIPLLAGPGTITSILLLSSAARGNVLRLALLGGVLALVFALSWTVLEFGSERVVKRLGVGGVHIVTRVLGILLAALAVQFILDGLEDYFEMLRAAS